MPFTIHKSGDGFKVVKKSTGAAIPGTSDTKAKAVARIGAIESSMHMKGKDMERTPYDANSGDHDEPISQTFGGTACGPLHSESVTAGQTPENPYAEAARRVGPGGNLKLYKAVLADIRKRQNRGS